MKFLLPILLLVLTLLPLSSFAQANAFNVNSTQREYTPLTDATIILGQSDIWDDPIFTLPLGFDFTILDQTISTIHVEALTLFSTNDAFDSSTIGLGFGLVDIISRADADGVSHSLISYKTEGSPGSRIFKLELQNVGLYEEMGTPYEQQSYFTYQVWIYEEDNSMEMIFGESYINGGDLSAINDTNGPLFIITNGWDTSSGAFLESWVTNGTAIDPVLNYNPVFSGPTDFALNEVPPPNSVLRFGESLVATQQVAIEDLAVFPSLANEFIQVKSDNSHTNYHYQITTVNGQIVSSTQLTNDIINVSHLNKGMYFITLVDNEQIISRGKFIKQ